MSELELDFIGVGAAKTGTTWLAACLDEHPAVCMSVPKELNYFCTEHIWPSSPINGRRGGKWLQERFPHWRPDQIRGEISPSYLIDPSSPRLIRTHNPDAKILISFRNPTDSLYSLYHQGAQQYPFPDTFEGFLTAYPHFVEYGFYYTHAGHYLENIPLDNLHFVLLEDIASHPENVISGLFEFLGVSAAYRPSCLYKRVHGTKAPRSMFVRDLVGGTMVFFRSNSWTGAIKRFLKMVAADRFANFLLARNLRAATIPPMRADTRARLVEVYAEEVGLLGGLLNRDLSLWNELEPARG